MGNTLKNRDVPHQTERNSDTAGGSEKRKQKLGIGGNALNDEQWGVRTE